MKKIIILTLALIMTVSMAACGAKDDKASEVEKQQQAQQEELNKKQEELEKQQAELEAEKKAEEEAKAKEEEAKKKAEELKKKKELEAKKKKELEAKKKKELEAKKKAEELKKKKAAEAKKAKEAAAKKKADAAAKKKAQQTKQNMKSWKVVSTARKAAKGAGCKFFSVPKSFTVGVMKFRKPKYSYKNGVAQATYETAATMVYIRKADGKHKEPISERRPGEFNKGWKQNIKGLVVKCYGVSKENGATLVQWSVGKTVCAVTCQGLGGEEVGMDPDEISSIINAIQ